MAKYILSLLVLIVVGCATINEEKRMDLLEIVTYKYEKAVRWGYYDMAVSLIKQSGEPEHKIRDRDSLKNIRVSSYEVLDKSISKEELKAVQVVEIKYYHIQYLIEKVLIEKQLWEYDESEEMWYKQGGLPDFEY